MIRPRNLNLGVVDVDDVIVEKWNFDDGLMLNRSAMPKIHFASFVN